MTTELFVQEDTTGDELLEYVRECAENPVRIQSRNGENVVWNFSSYDVVQHGLDLHEKRQDEFVIPFQVTSTWAMMFVMLPERIREAENLIWRPEEQEYYAYNQFYRDIPNEQIDEFKSHLAKSVPTE